MRSTTPFEDRELPDSHRRRAFSDHSEFAAAVLYVLGALGSMAAWSEESPLSKTALGQYRMASRADEISLARSAAPASVSADAEVLVLGERGYETAVKGKNGFVCLVERSWFASFSDPDFWNPHIRGPDCLNPSAARTVLPANLERTQWVLAGLSKAEILTRTQASPAAHQAPAPGSIGYMMSKQQQLTDGHWHPHLMFFAPHTAVSEWGANLPGSPVLAGKGDPDEPTIFFVPLGKWSDGSSADSF